jgi:hypothetical protein
MTFTVRISGNSFFIILFSNYFYGLANSICLLKPIWHQYAIDQ